MAEKYFIGYDETVAETLHKDKKYYVELTGKGKVLAHEVTIPVEQLQPLIQQNTDDIAILKNDVNPTPISQCWVSTSGLDTNNGGMNKPFRTIQKALDGLFSQINILAGSFTENITIPAGYGLYGPVIKGIAAYESPKTFITGTITINAGISRVRFKDMLITGNIIDNGSEGRHVLENVTVSGTGDLIKVINGKNWWNITDSTIEGIINLSGTGNNATFNIVNCENSFLCTPAVNLGYTFTAFYVGKMGMITHNRGNVFASYVGAWMPTNGKIINSVSTNALDIIGVGYSSFTADTINYGTISSAGATVIKNYNVESLYNGVCLSAVSTVANTIIPTTPITIIAPTKKFEQNISYNTTNGELTFLKSNIYSIAVTLKVDCTEWNKKIEMWFEKFNTTTSLWEIVTDTGFVQFFQTDQENVPHYDLAGYFTAGEKYRLRAVSDSDTTVSLKTITLANGVKMPAIRVSITQ